MGIILSTLAGLVILRLLYEFRRDRKLPPGPRRLPFIGNIHQVPQVLPWRTFDDWSKKYGPIWSAQFGRQTMIMIADPAIARELLDKRGSVYSDRPRMVMANENVTKGMHLLVRHYDDRYRLHQRMEAPVLSPRASSTYHPIQDLESKQLLHDFLGSNDFHKIIERYSVSLLYALTYGFRLETGDEQEIHSAREVLSNFVYAGRPGTWIVDAIPILNRLPAPFTPWKKEAERLFKIEADQHMRNMNRALTNEPWNWTKEFSNSKQAQIMPPIELAYDLGILANAGMETTSAVMQIFVLAAVTRPRFISVAQEELDRVVGTNRLPEFSDRDNLPYIIAIVEETLRWRPMVPGGFPHATQQDDTYMGYRIPKGATVIPLFWSMTMDETRFENPDDFCPERWLDRTEGGFTNWFGYGRRVCTGRHIAMNSLYLLIARILWAYNIRAREGPDGKPEKVDDMAFGSGFVSMPEPFNAPPMTNWPPKPMGTSCPAAQ
ncbi:cytochrome P450 [Aspergillus steynii IBT 23096]|uniref:Cytochrome P450 n=1 Tax=Aspergillus steynii IBT 23096 TaxID=1392250 RepID=A0A2I2G0X6_9EURO|nr:cytochrome P450 [Aspergillus steynii IBT 23096]PLB46529.1 cytochrome P450 [Aspergillus steynii IBT 23096]